jgi:hypothetical protein
MTQTERDKTERDKLDRDAADRLNLIARNKGVALQIKDLNELLAQQRGSH